jgi:hypothetical protein
MNASVVAVCAVVHKIKYDAGIVGRTAIDKRPVDGPVRVGMLGLPATPNAIPGVTVVVTRRSTPTSKAAWGGGAARG